MKRIRKITSIISLLAMLFLPAVAAVPDSIDVKATEQHDSVEIQVTAYKIETQLTFLMQGLNIRIEQPDTVTLSFPSAPMVKNKVKRHPNEVKAVLESGRKQQATGHDSINHVVRPDVLPLVAALNDTTATISYMVKGSRSLDERSGKAERKVQSSWTSQATKSSAGFSINVDREKAVMVFSIKVPICFVDAKENKLQLCIFSVPVDENRQEFTGRRLSGETSPRPKGLGEGFRKGDAASRTFRKSLAVAIDNKR